jgi:hypothetical protein
MPTRAEVERAAASVPVQTGVIVTAWPDCRTLAFRAPAERQERQKSAVMIVFDPPPFADSDPRSEPSPRPVDAHSAPTPGVGQPPQDDG